MRRRNSGTEEYKDSGDEIERGNKIDRKEVIKGRWREKKMMKGEQIRKMNGKRKKIRGQWEKIGVIEERKWTERELVMEGYRRKMTG